MTDLSMNAEAGQTAAGLSYWQLVRRRFLRNRYGMIGLVGVLLVVFSAVFAGVIAPNGVASKDRAAIYQPPQGIHLIAPEGGLTRPYIMGFSEEMDAVTFEITVVPDPEKRQDLALFVSGDEWSFLGLSFATHLFGTVSGEKSHLLGTASLGRDVFSRMIRITRITLLIGGSRDGGRAGHRHCRGRVVELFRRPVRSRRATAPRVRQRPPRPAALPRARLQRLRGRHARRHGPVSQ